MTVRTARAGGVMAVALALATHLAAAPALATGDAERGRALFADKQCARCHRPEGQSGVGPAIDQLRRPQGAFELTGRMWNHAPAMFTALVREAIEWPRLTSADAADLMAYLRAEPARDGTTDLLQGQAALVTKGCLKCHALNGEGARVAADLGQRRPEYADPAAWGAAVWTHTPRMAEMARQRGILYPRFDGNEMANLVAFLRSAAR
jgi:cytochrome c